MKAVADERGVAIEPGERIERRPHQRHDQRAVAGPVPELRQDDREERRGGDRAVVPSARVEAERGLRIGVGLVEHPARLLVAPGVVLLALTVGQRVQAADHHLRTGQSRLPRRGQGVAPEQRDVHREPGGHGPALLRAVQIGEPQRCEVPLGGVDRPFDDRAQIVRPALSTSVEPRRNGCARDRVESRSPPNERHT